MYVRFLGRIHLPSNRSLTDDLSIKRAINRNTYFQMNPLMLKRCEVSFIKIGLLDEPSIKFRLEGRYI